MKINLGETTATIALIGAHSALPPWHPNDYLAVILNFDPPIGSTMGSAVEIPVKSYTEEELAEAVRREGTDLVARLKAENLHWDMDSKARAESLHKAKIIADDLNRLLGIRPAPER